MRMAARYGIAALGCMAFNFIYAQFAHGISSAFMTFMFLIPLVAGAVPALALRAAKARPVPRATRQAWALAIACLTIASCLHGVFDIAGTSSAWLFAYLAAAIAFAVVAIIATAKQSTLT